MPVSGSLVASPHFDEPHARQRSARRPAVVRTSPRPLDALLHRDVGAVQLLRDARAPHPLPRRVGADRRVRDDRQEGRRDLRPLRRRRVPDGAARTAGSPTAFSGSAARCSSAARIIAAGHFCMAVPTAWSFYLGLCLIVCGTGLLKPNVERDGRGPVSRGRRAAAIPASRSSTGHQHRRVHRSAHLRLAGREDQLALRVRRGRRRNGLRLDPVPTGAEVPRHGGSAASRSDRLGSAAPCGPPADGRVGRGGGRSRERFRADPRDRRRRRARPQGS